MQSMSQKANQCKDFATGFLPTPTGPVIQSSVAAQLGDFGFVQVGLELHAAEVAEPAAASHDVDFADASDVGGGQALTLIDASICGGRAA